MFAPKFLAFTSTGDNLTVSNCQIFDTRAVVLVESRMKSVIFQQDNLISIELFYMQGPDTIAQYKNMIMTHEYL